MKDQYNSTIARPTPSVVSGETTQPAGSKLEVNVIFTEPRATAAALHSAASLARDLGAHIQLRAAIAVPVQLPLDRPQVSVPFIEGLLSRLARRLEQDIFEPAVHVYLCRDQVETLSQVMNPHSLVVIGGRKHWWPTEQSRIAKMLQAKGYRVVFVALKKQTNFDLQ